MTGPARLAVGAAASALVGGAIGLPAALVLSSVVLATAAAGRAREGTSLRRLLPIGVGALLVCARLLLAGPPAAAPPLPSGSGPWLAVVQSVGSPRDGSRPAVIALDGTPGVRLAATLPWYPEVGPGDEVRIDGTPEAPPDGDGYADYLRRIGASGTIRVRRLELAPVHGSPGGPTWEGLRSAAADGLERALPEPEGGLAAGILVGLRDRVDRGLAAAFRTAGVSHIVAISGWNIAIVATTLGALTGRLGRRRRTIATGLAIAAYVAFVGPSASVVRAGGMAGCALLARELGRPTSALAAMGLAVTGLLLLDPNNVTDPGFQLSVLATAGLISWGTDLARRLAGRSPGRLRLWLAESLGVSLAAQAATLPAILLDFGRLSVVSPAVNLVVAPLVAPAMAAGGVALVGGLVAVGGGPSGLATLLGLPAWALLGALVALVRLGAALPFASLTLDPPANLIAAGVSAAALLAVVRGAGGVKRLLARARRAPAATPGRLARAGPAATDARTPAPGRAAWLDRSRRLVAVAIGAATLAVGVAAAHHPDGATRITILDVGQGDAILIEGGGGSRLLVDGGPDPGRLLVALDERLPPWDRRIDAVVLTHPHEDHVAGLAQLLGRYRVARAFEPGMVGPGPGYAAWEATLADGGPALWALGTGDRLAVDDVALRVLWPDPGAVPLHPADTGTAINNVSIVFLGDVAGHRFLLTGDMEQAVDQALVGRGLPTVELLKVAHHGSRTASTEPFLDAVRPTVAVISVGAGNPYGHPAPEAIGRLRHVASRMLRTDLDGSVTVSFDGSGMHLRTAGPRRTSTLPLSASMASGVGRVGWARDEEARLESASLSPLGIPPTDRVTTPKALPSTSSLDLRHPAPLAWAGSGPRYHRLDDGPVPGGGGAPAPVARPTRVARSALARRRGDRRLAGPPSRASGHASPCRHRTFEERAPPAARRASQAGPGAACARGARASGPTARGSRGAAARRRQGHWTTGSRGRSARRGRCPMACRAGPPRAG